MADEFEGPTGAGAPRGSSWRVEEPTSFDLEGVRALEVRLVGGSVDVVGGADDGGTGGAHVEISRTEGPLTVSLADDGTLLIAHEKLSWGGIFDWLGGRRASAVVSVSVPSACRVKLGVVTADAVVSGVEAGATAVKSVSGDVTLDGVAGDISARTVSGDLETRRLDGDLDFTTVSGDLTVVDGSAKRLAAQSVSGDVTLDLGLTGRVALDVRTVSGDLTVRMPVEADLDVDVQSTSGSLQSAFGGLDTERTPGKARMRGRIGGGHGRLRAKTVSGDVTLLARVPS